MIIIKRFDPNWSGWLVDIDKDSECPWEWVDFYGWLAHGMNMNGGAQCRSIYMGFEPTTGKPVSYYSTERSVDDVVIADMVVKNGFRGIGYGKQMIRHQEILMQKSRRKILTAYVDLGDPAAAFFKSCGFTGYLLTDAEPEGEFIEFRKNIYADPRNRISDYFKQVRVT